VAGAPQPVTRDAAARAVRVSRALAAFHLDKLVAAGLLEASYRRLTRRGGPGAGRPAKLYRRSSRQVELSLPQRSYELAARLLAERRLGEAARDRAGPRPSRARLLTSASGLLRDYGFEPLQDRQVIRLRNCPFDALARDYRSLVCGMNLALMEGLLAGLAVAGVRAELDPQPGMCCVALRAARKPA
jgi:predicted ArsR family transcriptional regulator